MDDVSIQYIHRSEPYDPYLPRDGSSSSSGTGQGNPKTAAIQAQINDTVGIMKTNLDKVMERGELVDSLHDKTGMRYPFPCFFLLLCIIIIIVVSLLLEYGHLWLRGGGNFTYLLQRMLTEIDLSCFYLTDNLAVSAQGFRRGANRVRKVRVRERESVFETRSDTKDFFWFTDFFFSYLCRICGK